MIQFILNSFTFKGIFSNKDAKGGIVFIYFLIILFATSFPLNVQIIQNNGWDELNTVTYAWKEDVPSWIPDDLPNDVVFSSNGMMMPIEDTYIYQSVYNESFYTLVINPIDRTPQAGESIHTEEGIKTLDENGEVVLKQYEKTIVLCKDKVIYYYEDDEFVKGDYSNIKDPINLSSLKGLDQHEAASIFLSMIDGCFSPYMVLSNVLISTLTQLLLNIILVFMISGIFMLVKVNYQRITNYGENVKIIISSMTIPTLISFVIGIIGIMEITAFSVVLFQLITPLLALGAIYKGSGIKTSSTKYVA